MKIKATFTLSTATALTLIALWGAMAMQMVGLGHSKNIAQQALYPIAAKGDPARSEYPRSFDYEALATITVTLYLIEVISVRLPNSIVER
jgi:hypothetical protein